ncbi:hypothetical protein BH20ACI1_BH20ACI1_17540 [soil metagenome]
MQTAKSLSKPGLRYRASGSLASNFAMSFLEML